MKPINESVNKASLDYPYIGIGTRFENSSLHFHNEIEFSQVLEGEISATVETENFILKKGDICIILPGQIHTLFEIGQISLSVVKILPSVSLLNTYLEKQIFKCGDMHYTFLSSPLEAIREEDGTRRIGYHLAVSAACAELLLYIIRNLARPTQDTKAALSPLDTDFFEAVHSYVEKNYKRPITLLDVSASAGYSCSYFSRRFKAVCGMNFYDYLSVFRLKKSIQLLHECTLPIEGIALSCGYQCLRTYNRAFLKYFGKSPGSYRRLYFSKQ